MTTIKLKNSTVLNKAPVAGDLEIGELAINANVGSPGAYIKDTDDNIIKIAGSGVGEIPTLQEVTDEGSTTTQDITADKFIGDGSQLTNLPAATPQDLQSVLNEGNVATLGMTLGTTITLAADGAGTFSGILTGGALTTAGTVTAGVFDIDSLPALP